MSDTLTGDGLDVPANGDALESSMEITHAGFAVQAADTGRVLMIQRSLDQDDAPEVRGTWEFPGGGIEEGDESPEAAARREFSEETGLPVPKGEVTGGWRSPDGVYQGYVFTTPVEADAFPELNPDLAAAEMVNPDDPERRNPDVSAWFTIEQILNLGPALRPECYDTDWTQFQTQEGDMSETPVESPSDGAAPTGIRATCPGCGQEVEFDALDGWQALDGSVGHEDGTTHSDHMPPPEAATDDQELGGYIPFHGVACVENHRSGDGRGMRNLRRRPLPQAGSWQKVSGPGHSGSVVVMRTDSMVRVGQEIRVAGVILPTPEGDEFVGLVSHFPRFGVSIDADSTDITLAYEDAETGTQWYENGRIASHSALPIPAFAEAWLALGEGPDGFMDGEELEEDVWENEAQALVASAGVEFMNAAVETFKRGPGWVTNPEDTRRLHDYWTKPGEEGYAKISWGAPGGGDFNRCRLLVGEKIAANSPEKMRFLNQICAQWHYDALGFWPGHAPTELAQAPETVSGPDGVIEPFRIVDREQAALVASAAGFCAPAEFFEDPQFNTTDGRMVQAHDGTWGAPLQVTAEGEVWGHIAKWGVCHTGVQGSCTVAPHSTTDYAYFRLGQVLTTEGMVPCGALTIGGGHADLRLGMRPAMAHYDSTSSVWAYVNVGEDEYGIWAHGWVAPGTTEEQVVAARASKISGDWRPVGRSGQYELMAALSVVTPGFPVPRIHIAAGLQTALVAAGVVGGQPSLPLQYDSEALETAILDRLEARLADRRETASLMERFANEGAAEQAALLARFE